jgi:multiple sugar transport system substrate-binding protein
MPKKNLSRRDFLKGVGGLSAGLAASPVYHPFNIIMRKSRFQGQELSILQWSHFVPQYDEWFDPWAQQWGEENGVTVTVDHVNLAEIPAAATSEISAGEGHDLIEFLTPPSSYEPSVVDLTDVNQMAEEMFGERVGLTRRSTYNPTTDKFYGFCHSWVPDPGNYRRSLWEEIGMPNGPTTYEELLTGGAQIRDELGVQLGIGMSNELDSNMANRAILWAHGASIQDANENVVINSPETIAALEYMKQLYEQAMTPEVFSWVAASNNQLLIAGQASYILNSISAYRTAQSVNPEVANDVFFLPPLVGPAGEEAAVVSEHVIPIYMMPQHSMNQDIAKQFLLDHAAQQAEIVNQSQLYNFPAFFDQVPELTEEGGWLDDDPYGSEPADKLSFLKTADQFSTVVGHPGPANPAIGEVFGTFVIPQMFAQVARGELTPQEAVEQAEEQIVPIFDRWREEGLIGGGS